MLGLMSRLKEESMARHGDASESSLVSTPEQTQIVSMLLSLVQISAFEDHGTAQKLEDGIEVVDTTEDAAFASREHCARSTLDLSRRASSSLFVTKYFSCRLIIVL